MRTRLAQHIYKFIRFQSAIKGKHDCLPIQVCTSQLCLKTRDLTSGGRVGLVRTCLKDIYKLDDMSRSCVTIFYFMMSFIEIIIDLLLSYICNRIAIYFPLCELGLVDLIFSRYLRMIKKIVNAQ